MHNNETLYYLSTNLHQYKILGKRYRFTLLQGIYSSHSLRAVN